MSDSEIHSDTFRHGSGWSRAIRTTRKLDRVVVALLEGIRAETVQSLHLSNLRSLLSRGAQAPFTLPDSHGMTSLVLSSLLTGFASDDQPLLGDGLYIPEGSSRVRSVPRLLHDEGLSTAVYMADPATAAGAMSASLKRDLRLDKTHITSIYSAQILSEALRVITSRAAGLTLLHFPEPALAGRRAGWDSQQYADAAHRLDETVGFLSLLVAAKKDPGSLFVVVLYGGAECANRSEGYRADLASNEGEVVLVGPGVHATRLQQAQLCDLASTIVWALGLPVPSSYEGRVVTEAFATTTERALGFPPATHPAFASV
ncbi:MAG TPA: alkaline phosphatase family protein [Gemmatimonadaceae bacterium]|nr:alkaline phosphatase family protein [Gemmatimonadaceae bacterium]